MTENNLNQDILDIDNLELYEASGTFHINTLLSNDKLKQIAKTQLDLKSGQDIQKSSIFHNLINRQNIIYFGKIVHETPIRIDQCNGHICINLIDQEQIFKQLQKIPSNKRIKIGYIHLSTIQILLKSTFQEGIDSPIRMAILDERMTNLNDQIIGIMNGNLFYKKIKLNARLKIGLPLQSKGLEKTITIAYKFYNENLMTPGQYPFSITYQISYALTNSHHSVDFKNTEKIYIDQLFNDVAKVGTNFKTTLTSLPTLPTIQYPIDKRYSFSDIPSSIPPLTRSQSFTIERPLRFHTPTHPNIHITNPSIASSSSIETTTKIDKHHQQLSELTTYLKQSL